MDGSNSIGKDNFDKIKDWVISLTDKLNVYNNYTQVGVIQYSHYFEKSSFFLIQRITKNILNVYTLNFFMHQF